MIRRFLGALQFLTVFPIHVPTATPGESALFFPVVGALLGLLAGATLQWAGKPFGASLSALLALALLVAVSGGLHEDGLADCADALRVGRTQEKMMTILKDSRVGVYGAITLFLMLAIRWQALGQIAGNLFVRPAAVLAISRSSLVMLAASTLPVGDGLGASFAATITKSSATAVAIQMFVAALLCGWRGIPMLIATAAIIAASRVYFIRRLGGVNGDCLGATCVLVETANLLVLTWRPSI